MVRKDIYSLNKDTYSKTDVVKIYTELTSLQPPEKTILDCLATKLSEMSMLDLGVGAGRTTLHFARYVKEYIGIDYSEEMISECERRFSRGPERISFKLCDVRFMETFDENIFDFILFSYNGIDCISHKDRLKVLKEIQRLGKPGSYFCFSSHNQQAINKIFSFQYQLRLKPRRNIARWWLLNFIYNKYGDVKKAKKREHVIINDGAHGFSTQMYYIKPIEQIRQLNGLFRDVQVYSLDGIELKSEAELNSNIDTWLYYLCVNNK